jgi:hypothetical protein
VKSEMIKKLLMNIIYVYTVTLTPQRGQGRRKRRSVSAYSAGASVHNNFACDAYIEFTTVAVSKQDAFPLIWYI